MTDDFSDDKTLLEALEKGDEKAFAYLMHYFFKKLCVYAYSLCKDKDQAEDIVQNVFLKLWKRRESLNNTIKLNGFLYKSVYNEFIDQYRQTKKVILLEKKHIDLLSKVVDEEPDSNFEKLVKTINTEIDNLPPKCKEVVILSKKEGLTNIEIAEFLKISIKSVESHITKAYKIIKDRIKK